MRSAKIYLIALILTISGLLFVTVGFTNQPVFASLGQFLFAGTIQGTGTHFEITDSEYFNVILDSSEEISLYMESMPEMITMTIEPVFSTTTTHLTISGLAPATTFYKFENNYHNITPFTTDGNGTYSYTQDISETHFVFIQPRVSTKFIIDNATGGDCTTIGTWNTIAKTCTLTTNVFESIQIDNNGITLDGNGHTVTGSNTGVGVLVSGKTGVSIQSLTVKTVFSRNKHRFLRQQRGNRKHFYKQPIRGCISSFKFQHFYQ